MTISPISMGKTSPPIPPQKSILIIALVLVRLNASTAIAQLGAPTKERTTLTLTLFNSPL